MKPPTPYEEALAPVTERMLAEAGIARGQRVLDVGSGSGDMAMAAAGIVGRSGHVRATDISLDAMAGLLERCRGHADASQISLLQCAAESLSLEPRSFDVALARNSVMYFHNLAQAIDGIHRALRPGGRFVVSVYGPLEREPFHAIPIAAVQRRGGLTEPLPEYVQAFRVSHADVVRALQAAGFMQVHAHVVAVGRTYPTLQVALDQLRTSPSFNALFLRLPSRQVDSAWSDIAAEFGRYESASGLYVPGEQVVLAAVA